MPAASLALFARRPTAKDGNVLSRRRSLCQFWLLAAFFGQRCRMSLRRECLGALLLGFQGGGIAHACGVRAGEKRRALGLNSARERIHAGRLSRPARIPCGNGIHCGRRSNPDSCSSGYARSCRSLAFSISRRAIDKACSQRAPPLGVRRAVGRQANENWQTPPRL